MTVVKRKEFVNASDDMVNAFLARIPAENIVSTHFSVYGQQDSSDTWTVIFYREGTGVESAEECLRCGQEVDVKDSLCDTCYEEWALET